jgi:hypothetical protein
MTATTAPPKNVALDAPDLLTARIVDPSLNVVELAAHRSPSAGSAQARHIV